MKNENPSKISSVIFILN